MINTILGEHLLNTKMNQHAVEIPNQKKRWGGFWCPLALRGHVLRPRPIPRRVVQQHRVRRLCLLLGDEPLQVRLAGRGDVLQPGDVQAQACCQQFGGVHAKKKRNLSFGFRQPPPKIIIGPLEQSSKSLDPWSKVKKKK